MLVGVGLLHAKPGLAYAVAFALTVGGLLLYHLAAPPPQRPALRAASEAHCEGMDRENQNAAEEPQAPALPADEASGRSSLVQPLFQPRDSLCRTS